MTWAVRSGDAVTRLREIPDASAQCVVTSPPYWGLRDYGVPGQLGLERTPEEYVAKMVEVFREVRRVLRRDGTLWLNLGDSYDARDPQKGGSGPNGKHDFIPDYGNARRIMSESAGSSDGAVGRADRAPIRNGSPELKPKDLVGIPWRVAFALQADGWWLRSDIIWAKPNPMPESVTDRPTKAHEYVFLLTKSERYYFDAEAVAERSIRAGEISGGGIKVSASNDQYPDGSAKQNLDRFGAVPIPFTRNIRSVWTIATQPFPQAHFATFPEKLVEPCVKAGSKPGDTALDPFAGSGTVGVVALNLGRSFVGIELSPQYVEIARKRIGGTAPLLAEEVA